MKYLHQPTRFATPLALLSAFLMLFTTACATTSLPSPHLTQQMGASETAVGQAKESGAEEYAPLVLRSAQQKMEQAQQAMARKDFDKAERLAEQAKVDAELAQVVALSTKAQNAANALQESIQALRSEIARQRDR